MVTIQKSKRSRKTGQFLLTCCFLTLAVLVLLFGYSFYKLLNEMQKLSISLAERKQLREQPQMNTLERKEDTNSMKKLINCEKCELECNVNNPGTFPEYPFVGFAGTKFVKLRRGEIKGRIPGKGWESGCVISHKYKFIYIHILKSGGTSMKSFLREGLCGSSKNKGPCPGGEEIFSVKASCQDMVRHNPEYFIWSLVRNPFFRMFSIYSMAMGDNLKYVDVTFDKYVLLKKLRRRVSKLNLSHAASQNKWLFDTRGCPFFDFIGRLEYIEEDMKHVLNVIDSHELNDLYEANGNTITRRNSWGYNNRKNHKVSFREIYNNPDVVESVATSYAKDFMLLGYNPDEVQDT